MTPPLLFAITVSEVTAGAAVTAAATCMLAVVAMLTKLFEGYLANEKLKIDNKAILDKLEATQKSAKAERDTQALAQQESIATVGESILHLKGALDGRITEFIKNAQENAAKDIAIMQEKSIAAIAAAHAEGVAAEVARQRHLIGHPGAQGPAGEPGEMGPTGTAGATGAAGAAGAAGATGATGATGKPGTPGSEPPPPPKKPSPRKH